MATNGTTTKIAEKVTVPNPAALNTLTPALGTVVFTANSNAKLGFSEFITNYDKNPEWQKKY